MFRFQKTVFLAGVVIVSIFGYSLAATELNVIVSTDRPQFVQGEILVKFKENKINITSKASIQQIRTFSINNDVTIQEKLPENNIVVVKTDPGQNMDEQISQLESDPTVEYAEPNYIYYTQSNDEYYGDLWGLQKISWPNAISLVPTPVGNTGTIVAVIDVGVDYNHPDLINNMRDGSSCKSDTGAFLGGCLHGYDFIEQDVSPLPTTSSHGTHVAGIIAATMSNTIGVVGVNPYAKIMALRVGDKSGLTSDAVIRAINFARENGARIINASFGGAGNSTPLSQAIQDFQAVGGIFVTAAGNNGYNHAIVANYPCDFNIDNIICVGSTSSGDTLSSFSDRSTISVDTVAPGEHINSTMVDMTQTTQIYETFEGTVPGDVPGGWIKSGTVNDRGVLTRADSFSKVLATNQSKPYADNNISSIQKAISLSGADGSEITFDVGCDTEYSTIDWKDYLSIQFSNDGGNSFEEQARLDEAYIDQLNRDSVDASGTAIARNALLSLRSKYLTSGFILKFEWVSNGVDNNHDGCFVDNVNVQKFKIGNSTYGYLNGTSMATPYVAGLVSLARNYAPQATPAQIKNAIIYSGDHLTGLDGKTVAGTRINAENTLLAIKTATFNLSSIHISSNNTNSLYAKDGDIITLSFTGTQDLSGVSAKINGYDAEITGTGVYRTASIPVSGSMTQGPATFVINYQDSLGITGTTKTTTTDASQSIVDTINPSFTITNPILSVTGVSMTINLTGFDTNGMTGVSLNTIALSGVNTRNTSISLLPGVNPIVVTGYDYAGNMTTISSTITKIPYTYSGTYTIIDANTVKINFNSDFVAEGFVRYGTGGLTDMVSSGEAINHSILLSNLVPNTTYSYQTYAVYQGSTGVISSLRSFKTPDIFNTQQGGNKSATGSVFFAGSSSTGVVFGNTGTVTIHSDTGNSTVSMIINSLSISTSGKVWNGIIYGPIQIDFTGTTPVTSNYTHVPALTFEVGNSDTSLLFSGATGAAYPTISLFVGTVYNSKVLKVYRSEDKTNYVYIADCAVANGICTFTTNSFSSFTILAPTVVTPPSSGGGGGGVTVSIHEDPVVTPVITPIIVSSGEVNLPTITAEQELEAAYLFAYKNNITTQKTIEDADMSSTLRRDHLAKMISNYAIKVVGKKPDTKKSCNFVDIGDETSEMKIYIKTACQLGLMGQNTDEFDPSGKVNRAQFSTILSRLLYGSLHEGGNPYYARHITALKTAEIIKSIDPNLKEMRGYVMLMLMRSQSIK